MGKTREDARNAGERAVFEALGVKDATEAAAAIEAARLAEDATKTELQRLQEAKERSDQAAAQSAELAKAAIVAGKLEGSLRDAGLRPERIATALKLADLSEVQVDGLTVTGIEAVIEGVKAQSPEWFGSTVSPPAVGPANAATNFTTASREEVQAQLKTLGVRL